MTVDDPSVSTKQATAAVTAPPPVGSSSVMHRSLALTLPLATRGEGNYLYLGDGSRVLDASGGAAVVSVGHAVPEIVEAVSQQLSTLPYVSSALFGMQSAEELAEKMCADAGMGRALFLTGGSEAVESAIKVGTDRKQ